MSQRRATEQRKKRNRREALAQAEREWVCGGPLVDVGEPIVGGSLEYDHAGLVYHERVERAERTQRESELLAMHFVRGCCTPRFRRLAMVIEWGLLMKAAGPPHIHVTHSTAPYAMGAAPVPRLDAETIDAGVRAIENRPL